MRRPLFRSTVVPITMVFLTACHTWKPYALPAEGPLPRSLRVESYDGQRVLVRRPSVEMDSALVGIGRMQMQRIPLDQIRTVESKHTHVVRSVLTGVGLVLVLLVGVVAAAADDDWAPSPGGWR